MAFMKRRKVGPISLSNMNLLEKISESFYKNGNRAEKLSVPVTREAKIDFPLHQPVDVLLFLQLLALVALQPLKVALLTL